MSVIEWSRQLGPEDATVEGLARLEVELFRPYPAVQATIEGAIADFAPAAVEIERRHDGHHLMGRVQARRSEDWRSSKNFGLAFFSFLIVVLPACAFGIALRGNWGFAEVLWTVAVLLAIAALLCLIKVISTLRDRVWAGVMPHWALGAAIVSIASALRSAILAAEIPDSSTTPLALIFGSAIVITAFAVLGYVRQVRSQRAVKADLADIQPQVDAYLSEFTPKYEHALARIHDAVETIDPNTRTRLKSQRDAVVAHLSANLGLYQGRVPPFMNKKELGEFQLFAVAEPMLGGGPYPTRGKPSRATRVASRH